MKFDRHPRYERFEWTSRKLALAKSHGDRLRAREAARVPLFAEQLPPPAAFDLAAETAMRDERRRSAERNMRDFNARVWRESRRDARSATPAQQAEIRDRWAAWRGPRTCLYYRYVVDVATGEYDRRSQACRERELEIHREVWANLSRQTSLDL